MIECDCSKSLSARAMGKQSFIVAVGCHQEPHWLNIHKGGINPVRCAHLKPLRKFGHGANLKARSPSLCASLIVGLRNTSATVSTSFGPMSKAPRAISSWEVLRHLRKHVISIRNTAMTNGMRDNRIFFNSLES